MEWIYLTFRSITPAQRAKAALERAEIRCTLIRAPGWMAKKGCGYALRLRKDREQEARELLRQREIPWENRYPGPPAEGGRFR